MGGRNPRDRYVPSRLPSIPSLDRVIPRITGVAPANMSSTTPGPIPIVRAGDNGQSNASEGTPLARQSGPGSYLGLSASLGGGSFKEAMALSFGKDVAEYVH